MARNQPPRRRRNQTLHQGKTLERGQPDIPMGLSEHRDAERNAITGCNKLLAALIAFEINREQSLKRGQLT